MKTTAWIPAALALGVTATSVLGSACFTSMVLQRAAGNPPVSQTPSLRVQHTYYDAKGRLVVLAEGGPWQSERYNTPRDPIWFEIDLHATNLPKASNGLISVSQDIIKHGTPDLDKLAQDGFKEIPFFESRSNPPRGSTDDLSVLPATDPAAKVVYDNLAKTQNFPEQLGYNPKFSIINSPEVANLSVQIQETKRDPHPSILLLLPVSIAVDAAGTPLYIMFLVSGNIR